MKTTILFDTDSTNYIYLKNGKRIKRDGVFCGKKYTTIISHHDKKGDAVYKKHYWDN